MEVKFSCDYCGKPITAYVTAFGRDDGIFVEDMDYDPECELHSDQDDFAAWVAEMAIEHARDDEEDRNEAAYERNREFRESAW